MVRLGGLSHKYLSIGSSFAGSELLEQWAR